jgi:triacylglycerol lipase
MFQLILHHGLMGFSRLRVGRLGVSYFRGIDRALAEAGYRIVAPRVHPTGSVARRAAQLRQALVGQLPPNGPKAVIVAHSMGGLDARYMIRELGMADRVAALLTIATPHRGSAYADWCAANLGRRLRGFALMRALGIDVDGLRDLTTEACAAFNHRVSDVPGVAYFSISAACPCECAAAALRPSHRIIQRAQGDNDGLVSVASARWGTHLDTWCCDHLQEVGWRRLRSGSQNVGEQYVQVVARIVGLLA